MIKTRSDIEKLCREYLKEYWNIVALKCDVLINNRLTSTYGRFVSMGNEPLKIEISGRLLNNFKQETIKSIIKHEVCHYALFILKNPNKDGHSYFENELKRIGACSTRTITPAGYLHEFKCTKCNKIVGALKDTKARNTIKNIHLCTSKCCHKPIEYIGKIYIEDTYSG
jgi:SprT-like protein